MDRGRGCAPGARERVRACGGAGVRACRVTVVLYVRQSADDHLLTRLHSCVGYTTPCVQIGLPARSLVQVESVEDEESCFAL